MQTILVLLGIGIFEPVFNPILKYCETLMIKPLEYFYASFFKQHLPSLNRWFSRHSRRILNILFLIFIALILGGTTLRPYLQQGSDWLSDSLCLHTSLPWSCSSGYGVSTLPGDVRIGLIKDNTYGPFDQSLFNPAEIAVEEQIFRANAHACMGQHITLIAATMLSRSIEDQASGATVGLQNLYGYALWQQDFNAHHSTHLCLALANLGTPDTANQNSALVKSCAACYSMPPIIHQMAQLAHTDSSVRGIVGFPYSQQAQEALALIQQYPDLARLPIISPTASSDSLSNTSSFYRVDAPDQSQGEALARYFCSFLAPGPGSHPAALALLLDNEDPYSGDLPKDFRESILKDCPRSVRMAPDFISYRNNDSPSIQRAIRTALSPPDNASYIFFPGYDGDLDTVEAALRDAPRKVTLLGGDGLNNVDATTHYAYTPVYAASFAQPLPLSDPLIRGFKQMSELFFQPYPFAKNSSLLWVPKDTLLAIDAVQACTQAVLQLGPAETSQDDFTQALQSVSFLGETGQIVFQGNRGTHNHISDRDQEMVYITCYDTTHTLNLMDGYMADIDSGEVSEAPPHGVSSHC